MPLYGQPSLRIPYDLVGAALFVTNGTDVIQATTAQMRALNDEDINTGWTPGISCSGSNNSIGIIFPQLMQINGDTFCAEGGGISPGSMQYSSNTTDGLNGGWNTPGGSWSNWSRTQINTLYATDWWRVLNSTNSVGAVRAIRYRFSCTSTPTFYAYLQYGYPYSTSIQYNYDGTPGSYLHIGDGQGNSFSGVQDDADFGDALRSTSMVKTFRVQNQSPTQTANNVTLTIETLTAGLPQAVIDQYSISGTSSTGPFSAPSANIGSIASGSYKQIWVRRSTPSDMPLGTYTCRMRVSAGSWS